MFAATRLNLENIMQSERRQSQSHILGDHLHTILRADKSIEQKTDTYLPKPGVWGAACWEVMAKGDRVSFRGHQCSKVDCGDGCPSL